MCQCLTIRVTTVGATIIVKVQLTARIDDGCTIRLVHICRTISSC